MSNSVSANVGDKIALTATITDTSSGDALDPSAVIGWTRSPGGTVTSYTYGSSAALTKTSTGVYKLLFDVDTPGKWHCGIYSTGTGKAASDDYIVMVKSSHRL